MSKYKKQQRETNKYVEFLRFLVEKSLRANCSHIRIGEDIYSTGLTFPDGTIRLMSLTSKQFLEQFKQWQDMRGGDKE